MAKLETLAQSWESLARLAIPDVPKSSIQYQETRKGFYAGARACFTILLAASDYDEEYAEALFQRTEDELNAFGEELKAELARRMK